MKKGKLIAAIATAACMAFAFAPFTGTTDVKAAENGTGTGMFYHGISVNNNRTFNVNDTIYISTNSGLANPNYASLGFPSTLSAKPGNNRRADNQCKWGGVSGRGAECGFAV